MAQCDVPSPASDGNDSRRMLWKALQALWLAHWQVSHASPVGDPILTGIGYQNKGPIAIPRTRQCGHVENPVPGQAGAAQAAAFAPVQFGQRRQHRPPHAIHLVCTRLAAQAKPEHTARRAPLPGPWARNTPTRSPRRPAPGGSPVPPEAVLVLIGKEARVRGLSQFEA